MTVLLEVAVVVALMLVNGALAMSELALMSSRRARLRQRAQGGDRGARAALRLLDDPTAFLSTVQIGITLVGILTGAVSGATLGQHLANLLAELGMARPAADTLGIGLTVVLLTYLSLVVGELVPKRLALADPERVSSRMAQPFSRLAVLFRPGIWLLRASTDLVLRLLGAAAERESRVTEEEIRALIAEGAQAGVVKPVEHELIEGVMQVADQPVRSIMTPRVDVAWLDAAADRERVRVAIVRGGHSRYPVCRGRLDDVIGIVHVRQLAERLLVDAPVDLASVVEPVTMVPEGTSVVRLVEMLRRDPAPLALVLDEYGAVEGLVTPADLLSAIAGELTSIGTEDGADAVRRADGSWLIDGRVEIHRLERLLGRRDLTRSSRYQTLAGLVLWELGRMPRVGDAFTRGDLRFEVVDLDRRRVDRVLVAQVGPAPAEATPTTMN